MTNLRVQCYIESQIIIIQADISVINSEQNIQDAQLLEIENNVENIEVDVARIGELQASLGDLNETVGELSDDLQESVTTLQETDLGFSEELSKLNTSVTVVTEDVEGLTAVTDDLLVSVVLLQETDAGFMEDIGQLIESDSNLDPRVCQLEVERTFGFHAVLGDYTAIPKGSVVVFPMVNINLGNGYNAETGDFLTVVGGVGLTSSIFISRYRKGERTQMDIRVNIQRLVQMAEDDGSANGWHGSSCGAAALLEEGK